MGEPPMDRTEIAFAQRSCVSLQMYLNDDSPPSGSCLFEGWRIPKPDFEMKNFEAVLRKFEYIYSIGATKARVRRVSVDETLSYLSGEDRKWADFFLVQDALSGARRPGPDVPGQARCLGDRRVVNAVNRLRDHRIEFIVRLRVV